MVFNFYNIYATLIITPQYSRVDLDLSFAYYEFSPFFTTDLFTQGIKSNNVSIRYNFSFAFIAQIFIEFRRGHFLVYHLAQVLFEHNI